MAKQFAGLGATICDTSADLPSSPVEGLIVFQKDTNELKIYDGASWISVLDTDTPPGLVHITTSTPTAVSTFNIDNCFSSSFTNYQLVGSWTPTSGQNLEMRMRNSGTTDSGSNYAFSYIEMGTPSAVASGRGDPNSSMILSGSDTVISSLVATIFNPFLASRTNVVSTPVNSTSVVRSQIFNGVHKTAASQNSLTIFSGASFTGTFSLYGYRI